MEEDGIRGAAQTALDCAVMTQAVALGQRISTAGPRQVTPRRALRKSGRMESLLTGPGDLAAVNGKLAAPDGRRGNLTTEGSGGTGG